MDESLANIIRGISSGRFPKDVLNRRGQGESPFLNRFPEEVLNRRSLGKSPFLNRFNLSGDEQSIQSPDAAAGVEDAATEARILADQNKEGLGYGGRDKMREFYDFATPVESGIGVATPNMGYDYTDEGYADLSSPVAMPRPSEMGGQHADWSNPVPSAAIGGVAGPGDYAGEITDFDVIRDAQSGYQTPSRVRSTARPSIPAFGMRRPGTSFDANIEVGGRQGGWFTPEEYSKRYYKFGRGA